MPIGRFARSCRLSIKALRHYDEQGILKPAFVDLTSGYRYYARRQARDAVAVSLLRSLGVSLPAVAAILGETPERQQALLAEEARRLADELRQRTESLHAIERLLREGALLPYEIQVRRQGPLTVAQRAVATTPDRLLADGTVAVREIVTALRAAGRPVRLPVMSVIDEPDASERLSMRVCVPVEAGGAAIPGVEVVELPGGTFATLLHRGPYEELHVAYHALHAWLLEHGHDPAGPIREAYRNDPAVTPADALETEVMLPIAG